MFSAGTFYPTETGSLSPNRAVSDSYMITDCASAIP